MSAVPPRIPGSQVMSTLEVDTVKMTTLMGSILNKLNTWKSSVTVASTANIALLSGLLTVDGVVLVAGNTVLVKNQTLPVQNGIYVVSAGAWYRADSLPEGSFAAGVAVLVNRGTVSMGKVFVSTNYSPLDVVGTDSLVFVSFVAGGLVIANKADATQATSISTGVTVNGYSGTITTQSASTASAGVDSFTVTNSFVLASSKVFLQVVSYSGAPFTDGVPQVFVSATVAGSFDVQISNFGANALAGSFVFNYLIV